MDSFLPWEECSEGVNILLCYIPASLQDLCSQNIGPATLSPTTFHFKKQWQNFLEDEDEAEVKPEMWMYNWGKGKEMENNKCLSPGVRDIENKVFSACDRSKSWGKEITRHSICIRVLFYSLNGIFFSPRQITYKQMLYFTGVPQN